MSSFFSNKMSSSWFWAIKFDGRVEDAAEWKQNVSRLEKNSQRPPKLHFIGLRLRIKAKQGMRNWEMSKLLGRERGMKREICKCHPARGISRPNGTGMFWWLMACFEWLDFGLPSFLSSFSSSSSSSIHPFHSSCSILHLPNCASQFSLPSHSSALFFFFFFNPIDLLENKLFTFFHPNFKNDNHASVK